MSHTFIDQKGTAINNIIDSIRNISFSSLNINNMNIAMGCVQKPPEVEEPVEEPVEES